MVAPMTEIALFDSHGRFIAPSDEQVAAAGWSGPKLDAFLALREAAQNDAAVSDALATAQQLQSAAFRRWASAKQEAAKAPRPSATDVARAAMGRAHR
jgi:hypothetical protein